EEVFSDEDDE
ncbi:unnamed protein product, partial [Discula destructiva]